MAMNVYLAIIPPDSIDQKELDSKFPKNQPVIPGVWVVAGTHDTCADVSAELGIIKENPSLFEGQGTRWGVVVKVEEYYGYFDRALWDKIDAWRRDSTHHRGSSR